MDCAILRSTFNINCDCCEICHAWDEEWNEEGGYYFVIVNDITYSACCTVAYELDAQGYRIV
jgi:hypothetical protein